ncbi:hypothetical protein Pint_18150 [Pistacia integerrima]|uniref:Uncharacterized protein n=1 Tax=Pistacia integerrima TaxID=434235 RepID=A0ACC0YXY3_9ROSI|nr:hypothetical protein Pint_18150 [Pistacia integerrima]
MLINLLISIGMLTAEKREEGTTSLYML